MPTNYDPTTLEIYRSLYTSVAEEMGQALRRTAFSPNIKERRDYSCAVFDATGRVIAQGDHMPVHLGSMPMAVSAALAALDLQPGDVAALNDPYAGGTHLPDVTLVMGVFGEPVQKSAQSKGVLFTDTFGTQVQKPARSKGVRDKNALTSCGLLHPAHHSPLFYVANRAHHADIGGGTPGSMGVATDIYGEGVRIPPIKIVRGGVMVDDIMQLLLANMRGADERRADFAAQIGSLQTGAARLRDIVARRGASEAQTYAAHLIAYSARLMRHAVRQIPDGVYCGTDYLDSDGVTDSPVKICVTITIDGEAARVDFTDSAPQVAGPVNAVEAITVSAVSYVFRCLLPDDVPASAGLLEPLEIIAPTGTVVNARPPAAVAGGNVETSQRLADVLFKALAEALPDVIPAASQGTMNNLTIGGTDPRTGREFSYYETIAGGMGARPDADGLDAVHTHLTNSLNTPAEALEYAYPLRVRRYAVRHGSGGAGRQRGGDGVIREIEVLTAAQMSLLADRRRLAPYGLHSGADGATGTATLIKPDGTEISLTSKGSWKLDAGDVVRVATPGGGGFGEQI